MGKNRNGGTCVNEEFLLRRGILQKDEAAEGLHLLEAAV